MANKLMLVPEDMYKALISQQPQDGKDDEEGQINLNFIRKNMIKANDRPGKNLSAKNINYQQELRRYLKARKEIKEKPKTAVLGDGTKIILKPADDKNLRKRGRRLEGLLIDDDGNAVEEIFEKKSRYSGISHPSSQEFTPSNKMMRQGTSSSQYQSPLDYPLAIAHIPEARKLFEKIMSDPEKYGLNSDGTKVMKGKKPIKSSDIGQTILFLFQGGPGYPSPPGADALRVKLINTPFYKPLINDYKNRTPFRPKKWG